MNGLHPTPARALLSLFVLMAASSSAWAQDLDEPEEPAAELQANVNELHESNFEMWVFGNVGADHSAEDRLRALLDLTIEEVERACPLTEAQKKKLMLAGHGDLKRFTDRLEEARKVFFRLRGDQNNMNEIFQETQPLAAALRAGLFGEGSLFAKTIRTTLEPSQKTLYREALRDKDRFRYRAKISLAVATLDAAVGFTAEQRRRLIELTLEETTAPTRPAGTYEASVVQIKMSRIPEAKVRAILDDERYRLLSRQLQRARGMEQFLKANGFLDEGPPTPPAKPADQRRD